MQTPRYKDRSKVRERYNTSDATLYRWIKAGAFPAPVVIGLNTHRWDENVLDEYDADPQAWIAKHKNQDEAAA